MALLVIVGGGIGGLAVALEAAGGAWSRARGNEVLVLRQPDASTPHAEALRGHAWWQSGLHYARRTDADLDFAAQLSVMSRLMLDRLQLDLRKGPPGVMRIPHQGLPLFSLAIQQLGIRSQVRKLNQDEARKMVGPAYRSAPDSTYFEVPDRPFAEADLLAVLRMQARTHDVHLQEVMQPVRLSADPEAPCRCRVEADGLSLRPDALVLAAGCRTPALLEQLGIQRQTHQLVVDRTSLMVVTRSVFPASLVADYAGRWTATQSERGRCVFTMSGVRDEDVDPMAAQQVPGEHARALRDRFEQVTRCPIEGSHRFMSGMEIRKAGASAPSHVRFLVERAPRSYPGVHWVLPGSASLALAAAQLVVAELPRPTRAHGSPSALPGRSWQAPLAMMHSRHDDDAEGPASSAGEEQRL